MRQNSMRAHLGVLALVLGLTLVGLLATACGSSGGSPAPEEDTGSDRWNTLVWNQDVWGG